MEYAPQFNNSADLFSRACVESYSASDWTRFGYQFTQIFEPGVLREVAMLEGVTYESLTDLSCQPTSAIERLGELVHKSQELSVTELINLASALISISRFDSAAKLLDGKWSAATEPREKFEIAWLEFIISNRRDDGAASPLAFARMRDAIDSGGVPQGRVLDACTQGVVWYIKRREVPQDVFRWSVMVGDGLAKSAKSRNRGPVSAWYRGLAMLPASKGRASETRRYMELARDAAEATGSDVASSFDMNNLKTYYESSVKEHMYVSGDFESAEEAGSALIALDPAWAPSYAELAEVYAKFGNRTRAAELFEQAVHTGPPYVALHTLRAAKSRAELNHNEEALTHYTALLKMAPQSERVITGGLEVARRMSRASIVPFQQALDDLSAARV